MSKLLSPDQLAGIQEKLKRADEDILNLNVEINVFLKQSPDSGIPKDKREAIKEWFQFHAQRKVDPRFAVLAGEIVHHLRSCLDHIMWALSSESYRRSNERDIGFPILGRPPKDEKEKQSVYDRKIKGISSGAAVNLIEQLQPYHMANPSSHPLAVVNHLDRIDKHHNLVLVVASIDAKFHFPAALFRGKVFGGFKENDDISGGEPEQKAEIQLSRQVAFAELGEWKNQPVVPSLTQLLCKIRDIVHNVRRPVNLTHSRRFPRRVKMTAVWRAYAHPGKVAANDPYRIDI